MIGDPARLLRAHWDESLREDLPNVMQVDADYGNGETIASGNLHYAKYIVVLSGAVLEVGDLCVAVVGEVDAEYAHFVVIECGAFAPIVTVNHFCSPLKRAGVSCIKCKTNPAYFIIA